MKDPFFTYNIYFRIHKGATIDEIIDIPDVMFNPSRMRLPHFYDEIVVALERQPAQEVDAIVTAGVCSLNYLIQ